MTPRGLQKAPCSVSGHPLQCHTDESSPQGLRSDPAAQMSGSSFNPALWPLEVTLYFSPKTLCFSASVTLALCPFSLQQQTPPPRGELLGNLQGASPKSATSQT